MAAGGVEFAGVSFALADGRELLRGISLQCEQGTTTALLGRSGSGKTTLLRTVNALVRPTGGRVLVNGEDVQSADVLALRRGIGYVIQDAGLFPHMTVARNVTLPLEVKDRAFARRKAELWGLAVKAVRRVGLPEELLDRYPWQLSGGQRQRVGVARALVASPKVLLMDEPFGALDPLTRAEMQQTLRELLQPRDVTVLIVTHDLPEALFLADRVVLMESGEIVTQLESREVLGSRHPAVQAYVRAVQPREEGA